MGGEARPRRRAPPWFSRADVPPTPAERHGRRQCGWTMLVTACSTFAAAARAAGRANATLTAPCAPVRRPIDEATRALARLPQRWVASCPSRSRRDRGWRPPRAGVERRCLGAPVWLYAGVATARGRTRRPRWARQRSSSGRFSPVLRRPRYVAPRWGAPRGKFSLSPWAVSRWRCADANRARDAWLCARGARSRPRDGSVIVPTTRPERSESTRSCSSRLRGGRRLHLLAVGVLPEGALARSPPRFAARRRHGLHDGR